MSDKTMFAQLVRIAKNLEELAKCFEKQGKILRELTTMFTELQTTMFAEIETIGRESGEGTRWIGDNEH